MNLNHHSKTINIRHCMALLCIFVLSSLPAGCVRNETALPISKSGFFLNTVVTITLYGDADEKLLEQGLELCKSYERMFSKTIEGSDIYQINHSHGSPVAVSKETFRLIEEGIDFGRKSDGLFDISIGSVSNLWDFTGENPHVPDASQINDKLAYVDDQSIVLDKRACTIQIPEGMELDLGGIAKGYIGDKLKEFYEEKGISSGLLNLGGNVLCIGTPPDKDAFHIGIQRPFSETDSITDVYVKDACVVTSGVYERYFEADGQRYYHVLNPYTGYPADTDLYSATVICGNSMEADALSTSILMMGADKGAAYARSLENIQKVILITDEYEVITIEP